jgi:hypothetical protein
MKLYKLSQSVNNDYDTYSDAVVAAETAKLARQINPDGTNDKCSPRLWCHQRYVKVECIGKAADGIKAGLICASFHAG